MTLTTSKDQQAAPKSGSQQQRFEWLNSSAARTAGQQKNSPMQPGKRESTMFPMANNHTSQPETINESPYRKLLQFNQDEKRVQNESGFRNKLQDLESGTAIISDSYSEDLDTELNSSASTSGSDNRSSWCYRWLRCCCCCTCRQQQRRRRVKSSSTTAKLGGYAVRVMQISLIILLIDLLVYHWPMEAPGIEPRIAQHRPRPRFEGPLQVNERLDDAELLFGGHFHGPESMAWTRNKRAFFTGVEGGFIILVEPYDERWTVIARLNARNSVRDLSRGVILDSNSSDTTTKEAANSNTVDNKQAPMVPFCTRDIDIYGKRAEFEPNKVVLSRCSRPLGIRLAPSEQYLYVNDPLSGFYRVDLAFKSSNAAESLGAHSQVSKLIDFSGFQNLGDSPSERRVLFADDIAVDWAGEQGDTKDQDIIYMTDCSRRWTLRYLLRLMIENDDTGRLLEFGVRSRRFRQLQVTPVVLPAAAAAAAAEEPDNTQIDQRKMSFPNGVELTKSGEALLISDLNNRRVLKHYLRGPLAGRTQHLMWMPGYSDNIRRGLDKPDGTPTYWTACGCAVGDGSFELAEFANDYPWARRLFLKFAHFSGSAVESLGRLLSSAYLQDAGIFIKAIWLKWDLFCTHGLVVQFDEQGQVLRSLHTPHFSSNFKLLSEAHEVEPTAELNATNNSLLYLGSVYYSHLGRLSLEPLEASSAPQQSLSLIDSSSSSSPKSI